MKVRIHVSGLVHYVATVQMSTREFEQWNAKLDARNRDEESLCLDLIAIAKLNVSEPNSRDGFICEQFEPE